jgi:hypothetical protein
MMSSPMTISWPIRLSSTSNVGHPFRQSAGS